MALRWTTALSIGVPELDGQHEELFRRVDRLLDAMLVHDRSEAVRLLAFLETHVRDHFAAEERVMHETSYPDAEQHVAEHAAFTAAIAALVGALAERGPSAWLVLRLEREVTGWVRDHIYSTDLALGRYLVARRWTQQEATPLPAARTRSAP
jgi:hemerythrin